ncbi:hypothetical protein TVAG_339880 [Trichomonas vaginalis G3]|uniref:Uncharacterized protein n=1 Tax=Trichomonas vaginalis (strain ATCC PRA-98 / G3) TaxID=412133 RepID=A2F169_TRIV3|nr:hypothetical protein TVAGG3_0495250 [Trichomonas vaginalis G3]EAY01360.1 hypothetical protein TVAG_339880 [Trichomonas vaginalis G3]KAI5516668.1 hypothetical protein TVAGG3_0495250 [Trichomonas vaginalis G3]|eukprot:XP_001330213.1 hypothetical protein [Trichomonas vaginalis G3]
MQDLPFAKREPRIRAQTAVTGVRGPFDPAIEQSVPQNQQMISTRRFQYGIKRTPGLKCDSPRFLDSRVDQLARNRENIFFDSTHPKFDNPRLPQTPTATTRHMHTPYTYNTSWIDHPSDNPAMLPRKTDLLKSTFLDTSIANEDKNERRQKLETTLKWKNTREEQLENYKKSCDDMVNKRYTNSLERIRQEREDYGVALEARRKREHIHYFE